MSEPSIRERLIGCWRLVGYDVTAAEGGESDRPLGNDPLGTILYTPDGYMSAQLAKQGPCDGDQQPDAYAIAYSGSYAVNEQAGTVDHQLLNIGSGGSLHQDVVRDGVAGVEHDTGDHMISVAARMFGVRVSSLESNGSVHNVNEDGKPGAGHLLIRVAVKELSPAFLVFSRTKHGADRISKKLERLGHDVDVIHGDRSQSQRTAALKGFSEGAQP